MSFTQEQLVEQMPKLQRFALKLSRNVDDANDLVQDTLARSLQKKDLYHDDDNLFGWTSKIMYNLFVTGYRRKTKFESQYDNEDYINNQSIQAKQEEEVYLHEVTEAMAQLSDDQCTIVVMVCIQGMSYERAAEVLNVPVGTVRSRLARARERLADLTGFVL